MEIEELNEAEATDLEAIVVRTMAESDLDAVVRIDAASSGVRRPQYFGLMIERSRGKSVMQISLVAEMDNRVAGFAIGTLYFGEYGIMEPSASIEAIGVEPRARRHHVARALMRQLRLNLKTLGVTTLRTEVDWSDFDLLAFFRSEGFVPAPRLCLECRLDETKR